MHRARLLDGREVAVKVQYPDVERIVHTDLAALRRICQIYERFDPQPLELLPLLDELQTHLALELDFRREVENADRIRALFAKDKSVVVPEIDYAHSRARVITMELVSGIKVNDRAALEAAGLDPADVVAGVTSLWNQMIMGLGFFHADPHPGNVLVQAGSRGPRFVILDFGLAKQLPRGFGLGLFEMMFSMMTQNESAMIRAFKELGFRTKTGDPESYRRIARRDDALGRTGRHPRRAHRRDDRRADGVDPQGPDRRGAERLRAGRARLLALVRDRAHAGRTREHARRAGRRQALAGQRRAKPACPPSLGFASLRASLAGRAGAA